MKTKHLIGKSYALSIVICIIVSASAQTKTRNLTGSDNQMNKVVVSDLPSGLIRQLEFTDTLTLKSKAGNEIVICNSQGNEIQRITTVEGTNKIDISKLTAGRYLLKTGDRLIPFIKKQ